MRPLALVCVLTCSLAGQETPTPLDPLKTAFADLAGEQPRVAIFAVPGRNPLVLLAGKHGDGKAVTDTSLVALGVTARQLYGDALHLTQRKPLDEVEAFRIGEHGLSIQQLLDGSNRVPEFFVWPGGPWETTPTMDADTLKECVRVGLDAGIRYRAWRGTSDLMLLDPVLRGPRQFDVPTALRIALAPHVPGLDPQDARDLSAAQQSKILNATGQGAMGPAGSEPQALRLCLSVKALAAWVDWRRREPSKLLRGVRAGTEYTLHDYDGEPQSWQHFARGVASLSLRAYPGKRAMMVTSGFDRGDEWKLTLAFQEALFGPNDDSSVSTDMGLGISEAMRRPSLKPLGDGEWRDAKTGIRIRSDGVKLSVTNADGKTQSSKHIAQPKKNAWDVNLTRDSDRTRHRLILVLDAEPRQLRAVWMRHTRKNGTFPQYLVLEQEK